MPNGIIKCVAIIAKENYPLLIKFKNSKGSNSNDEELKFHYLIYASLDVVEEKINSHQQTSLQNNVGGQTNVSTSAFPKANSNISMSYIEPQGGLFLGPLYLFEDYYVYGFVSNTYIKFLLILEATSTSQNIKDSQTQTLTSDLNKLNIMDSMFFNIVPSPIPSPSFASSNPSSYLGPIATTDYVKSKFVLLQDAYVKLICNPFCDLNEPFGNQLSNSKLKHTIEEILS